MGFSHFVTGKNTSAKSGLESASARFPVLHRLTPHFPAHQHCCGDRDACCHPSTFLSFQPALDFHKPPGSHSLFPCRQIPAVKTRQQNSSIPELRNVPYPIGSLLTSQVCIYWAAFRGEEKGCCNMQTGAGRGQLSPPAAANLIGMEASSPLSSSGWDRKSTVWKIRIIYYEHLNSTLFGKSGMTGGGNKEKGNSAMSQ